MKELTKRTVSGVIFVLIIVLLIRAGSPGMFTLLMFINIFGLTEFYRLSYKIKVFPYKVTGLVSGILLLFLGYGIAAGLVPREYIFISILLFILPVLPPLFYQPSIFLGSWMSTLAGIIYVSLPLSLLPFIAWVEGTYKYEIILNIFIILWIYDSFAYLIGSWIGKHRIFPSVSPKKSWEGAVGGLVITVGSVFLLEKFFGILSLQRWIFLAGIIVITGTLGDFIESGIKRNAGLKDSGRFMPGHGGVLDRFDSLLFSVPFVFLYLYFSG